MSKNVLSIEQMNHLKDLGIDTSKANFYWHRTKSLNNYEGWDEWKLHYGVLKLAHGFTTIDCQYVRTFTFQDILDLLPRRIKTRNCMCAYLEIIFPNDGLWEITYGRVGLVCHSVFNESLIDAAYEMLCWVIENRYVDTKK